MASVNAQLLRGSATRGALAASGKPVRGRRSLSKGSANVVLSRVNIVSTKSTRRRLPCPSATGIEGHAADLAASVPPGMFDHVPEHLGSTQVVSFLSDLYSALNSASSESVLDHDSLITASQTIADSSLHGVAIGHMDVGGHTDTISSMAAAGAGAAVAGHAVASNMEVISGVSAWSSDRLSAVEHMDPEAFMGLKVAISTLLKALQQVLANAGPEVEEFGEALSYTVQSMMLSLKGGSPEEIEALNAAADAAIRASGVAAGTDMRMLLSVTSATVGLIVASVPPAGYDRMKDALGDGYDQLPQRYSPEQLDLYFKARPVKSLTRNTVVTAKIAGFCADMLSDMALGKWQSNMARRAEEARETIQSLGPAYIKMGQALSTRTDVIPPTYIRSLQRLQDDVEPFDTATAHALIEAELNCSVGDVFEYLAEAPVAAASLGQVYKGRLLDKYGGGEVAVKCQRPRVLQDAALDIYLLRRNCKILSSLPFMHGDWAAVLDDWALRFFQEMDYQLEAYNTMTFKRQMGALDGIVVPDVYPEFSSRYILTTSWITGEKLSDSSSNDVLALCDTILNCYLIQLLETGFLHADPHPGNLLRTPDGRVAILDFGLMSEVTDEQRVALVEYITHLALEDWDAIADDLVTLGFVPDGYDDFRDLDIKPVLKEMMGQLISGGGVGNISAARIAKQIMALQQDLQAEGKNYMIVIPPYFALIVRTFSVIEGIALTVDPDYAIVPRCMPYLSRRLLTDNDPRMRGALNSLIYGDKNHVDVERLHNLFKHFGQFSTGPAQVSKANGVTFAAASERIKGRPAAYPFAPEEPVVSDAMKEALKAVFSKDGSYAQELVVDELVSAVDAMSREALGEAIKMVLSSATTVAALQSMEALGPLRSMLMPLPMASLDTITPTVRLTEEDREALHTIKYVMDAVGPRLANIPDAAIAGRNVVQATRELAPMIPELMPGIQSTMEKFVKKLLHRLALRLVEDLSSDKGNREQPMYK